MEMDILKEQYNNLLEENDHYKKLISQQSQEDLISLQREITVAESKIQDKLTFPGGILKQKGKHSRHRKYIHILENKLNQDTIKFDALLCSNMDYRKDIAHLLQQKDVGCNIEDRFNKQLATKQNIIRKLGESFNLAFCQRSEAETRILDAREYMEVETVNFNKRLMQLETLIDHDAKLHIFMERKLQEMTPLADNEESKKRKKQQQYQSGVEKLEMYMQGHSRLVKVTRETNLHQIGHMFIENEQKNFASINYIYELQKRRNMLKNCTDKMKSDILFLEQEKKRHDEQSESQFKDLESELAKYSSLADSLEKQRPVFQKTLDQLKTGINVLLDEIMHKAVIVTFDNIAHFTSILEESINNLLIRANNVADKQMELPSQNLRMANTELLPECEAGVETEHDRSPSRSLKSA